MEHLPEELIKAVREYYEWHGDKNPEAVRFVANKNDYKYGYRMLLVRFEEEDGRKLSALMEFQEWKDGHWDVTEVDAAPREDEDSLVSGFVNSDEYV